MKTDSFSRTYTKRLAEEISGGPHSDGSWLAQNVQDSIAYCRNRSNKAMQRHAESMGMRACKIADMFGFVVRDGFACIQVRTVYTLAPHLRTVK